MALPSEIATFERARVGTHAVLRLFVATLSFGYVRLLVGGLDLLIVTTVPAGGPYPFSIYGELDVGASWAGLAIATGLLGVALRAGLVIFAVQRRREPLRWHPAFPFAIGIGGLASSVTAAGLGMGAMVVLARTMTPEEIAAYTMSTAMSGQLSLLFDWGISFLVLIWLLIASIASRPDEEREGPYREPSEPSGD